MTPEQFYSESKWPEMKDKFDKSALLFHYYDLCQFANDYAQQELFNSLPMTDKKQLYKDAEVYARQLGIDIDKEFRSDVELAYVDGATAEHERAQQELQAYRDIIRELLPLAEERLRRIVNYDMPDYYKVRSGIQSTISKARKLIDTVTPTI